MCVVEHPNGKSGLQGNAGVPWAGCGLHLAYGGRSEESTLRGALAGRVAGKLAVARYSFRISVTIALNDEFETIGSFAVP